MRLDLDLFVGITGLPVLQAKHIKEVLLYGNKQRIYLVSGSTKNIEFSSVINWLQGLRELKVSKMKDFPIDFEIVAIIDPLTENSQGTRIRIIFTGKSLPCGVTSAKLYKDILILADGACIGFRIMNDNPYAWGLYGVFCSPGWHPDDIRMSTGPALAKQFPNTIEAMKRLAMYQ